MRRELGHFICSVNPHDWEIVKRHGVYGNIDLPDGPRRESNTMSIIQDLCGIMSADVVFFHIIDDKKIFGVYTARSVAFYDETDLGYLRPAPNKILIEPHPNYLDLVYSGAFVSSEEFGELIESKKILDISTIEREVNALYHSVKRIFRDDGEEIIRALRKNKTNNTILPLFEPYSQPIHSQNLSERITGIGRLEFAIKAVATIDLSQASNHRGSLVNALALSNRYDFVFENQVSSTLKKEQDFFIKYNDDSRWINCEFKAPCCDFGTLYQTLRYCDLIRLKHQYRNRMDCALVGKEPREDRLMESIPILNEMIAPDMVLNIYYHPDTEHHTARFEAVEYPISSKGIRYDLDPIELSDIHAIQSQFPFTQRDSIENLGYAYRIIRAYNGIQNLGECFVLKKSNIEGSDVVAFMNNYRNFVLQLKAIPTFSETIPVMICNSIEPDARKYCAVYNDTFSWRAKISILEM